MTIEKTNISKQLWESVTINYSADGHKYRIGITQWEGQPFKDEAQTALFKDPVSTAQ